MTVHTSSIPEKNDTKPPGRVERRKAKTRASLIEAARRLFASKNIESTSVAEIAEEADIAVGSFYNYFETKDELLAALLESTLVEQLARIRARQSQTDDPAEKVAIGHRHLVDLATREPDLAWLIVRFEVPQRIASLGLAEAARADMMEGIATGRFDVRNPELSLRASGGALLGVIHTILLGELPGDSGGDLAAGVLMGLGMKPAEAREVAARPLPPESLEAE
ncbi:MAG TPA: helix-turn-helix domain-containing protein [Solirubrobacterales bacterium]|nr:helix-turn-helix domain-containing protein [Solirubrobacterales bacterium]HNC92760.1 helix-turn-helix domain-containing protein [Solirubrobacterales bacterium]